MHRLYPVWLQLFRYIQDKIDTDCLNCDESIFSKSIVLSRIRWKRKQSARFRLLNYQFEELISPNVISFVSTSFFLNFFCFYWNFYFIFWRCLYQQFCEIIHIEALHLLINHTVLVFFYLLIHFVRLWKVTTTPTTTNAKMCHLKSKSVVLCCTCVGNYLWAEQLIEFQSTTVHTDS